MVIMFLSSAIIGRGCPLRGHVVDVGELPQEVECLVGVGDAEVRQHFGRHAQCLGDGNALCVIGSAFALLVATNCKDADARSLCEIVLGEPRSFPEPLEGLPQCRRLGKVVRSFVRSLVAELEPAKFAVRAFRDSVPDGSLDL